MAVVRYLVNDVDAALRLRALPLPALVLNFSVALRLAMQPLFVLFLLPVLIGVASVALFRDTTKASCMATFASPLLVFACLKALDPDGTWNWLATLLVAPLAIAFALAAVMISYGRSQVRRRHPRNGA